MLAGAFDGMADAVAKVEDVAQVFFVWVQRHHMLFDGAALFNERCHLGGWRELGLLQQLLACMEMVAIENQAML